MARKKILINFREDLLKVFNEAVKAACINRDAYLNLVLDEEVGLLKKELPGPNSEAARRWLAKDLRRYKLKPVVLSLDAATADKITATCEDMNIPRDCFVNRVVFLLIAAMRKDEAAFFENWLLLPLSSAWLEIRDQFVAVPRELMGGFAMADDAVRMPPFYWIRACIAHIERDLGEDDADVRTTLHARLLISHREEEPKKAYPLNVYLPDDRVPGTDEYEKDSVTLDDLVL